MDGARSRRAEDMIPFRFCGRIHLDDDNNNNSTGLSRKSTTVAIIGKSKDRDKDLLSYTLTI